MTCLEVFCLRLDTALGEHSCELIPGHEEACRCACDQCLATAVPDAVAVVDGLLVAH